MDNPNIMVQQFVREKFLKPCKEDFERYKECKARWVMEDYKRLILLVVAKEKSNEWISAGDSA